MRDKFKNIALGTIVEWRPSPYRVRGKIIAKNNKSIPQTEVTLLITKDTRPGGLKTGTKSPCWIWDERMHIIAPPEGITVFEIKAKSGDKIKCEVKKI